LGTGPAIFLKRKNSVKLLMNATWAYFVNLSLALISFYWCCKSRGYAWTWVLDLKSKQACRRLSSLKKVCSLHKPFQKTYHPMNVDLHILDPKELISNHLASQETSNPIFAT
jgi:hypothetical protein